MKVELLDSIKTVLLSIILATPVIGEDTILWIKSDTEVRVAVNEHRPDPDTFHQIHRYSWDCWPKNTYSNLRVWATDRLGRVKEKVICLKDGETETASFVFLPIPEPEPTIPEPEPTIPEPEPTIPEPEPTIPEPEITAPSLPRATPELTHAPITVQAQSTRPEFWILCILLLVIIAWLVWLTSQVRN
jgi:hypothetical protein